MHWIQSDMNRQTVLEIHLFSEKLQTDDISESTVSHEILFHDLNSFCCGWKLYKVIFPG